MNIEVLTPQIHEIEIRKHFGDAAEYRGAALYDFPLLLLGFSNRSGSNLFAEYLASTGRFALFSETLNFDNVVLVSKQRPFDTFPHFVKTLTDEMAQGGRLPGFKANWMQIQMLYRLGITDMFHGVKIIHIRRRDLIGQSVSFWIAEQTQQWSSEQSGVGSAHYSFEGILDRLIGLMTSHDWINLLGDTFGAERLEIEYEVLESEPRRVIGAVMKFAGIPQQALDMQPIQLKKQRNDLNSEFRHRFVSDLRARLL